MNNRKDKIQVCHFADTVTLARRRYNAFVAKGIEQGQRPELIGGGLIFCYWAVRELGVSATELARRLGLSQPAVSIAVKRGERIALEKKLSLEVS